MSAAALLVELAELLVALESAEGQLGYRAPPGAMTPERKARMLAAKPALVAVASGAWRAEVEGWSAAHRDLWEERSAIHEFDGAQPRPLAEQAAYLDLAWHERERHKSTGSYDCRSEAALAGRLKRGALCGAGDGPGARCGGSMRSSP